MTPEQRDVTFMSGLATFMGLVVCPRCGKWNCGRMQWVDGYEWEYWTCLDCDHNFNVSFNSAVISREVKRQLGEA